MKSTTIIFFVALVLLHGCRASQESAEFRNLVGVLLVTGNEPFTDLSLQSDNATMYVIRKDTTALYKDLWQLQGRKVKVRYHRVFPNSDSPAIIVERYELVQDR